MVTLYRSKPSNLPVWLAVATILMAQNLALCAERSFRTLAERLPESTNALVAMNVTKMLASPYARQEKWASALGDAWANQPILIPPDCSRLLWGANIKHSTMEAYWEMVLADMENVPTAKELAEADGGRVDRIWDKDGAFSPVNAYYVPLDNRTLASISPAERSEIARWLRTPAKPEGNVSSEYIKEVAAGLSDKTDMVMALDLEGAWGVAQIRRFIDINEIKEVDPKTMEEAVAILGTLRGIRLDITVGADVSGRAIVDFGRDATLLKNSAKPILVTVLNAAGMGMNDLQQWTVSAAGKQVSLQGKLSKPSQRKLFGIVQSPIPAAAMKGKAGSEQAKAASDPATASQRYFRGVCAVLDSLREGADMSATASWMKNAGKRIDQLPLLNVDPALAEWGAMVSTRLKQAGAHAYVGKLDVKARTAGVMDPDYTNYYDNRNAVRAKKAEAADEKARIASEALTTLTEIAETRNKVRADMVQKYKVEF